MAETNWRPWAAVAAIGAVLYAGNGKPAAPPPARNWDVRAIWQPAPVTPPVVAPTVPVPPVAVLPSPPPAPIIPAPPVVSAPAPSPPPVTRQHVTIPQIVAPRPIVREVHRDKPQKSVKPRQNPPQQRAPAATEKLPPCSVICARIKGKSLSELIAMGNAMNPSPEQRAHGLTCYARCK